MIIDVDTVGLWRKLMLIAFVRVKSLLYCSISWLSVLIVDGSGRSATEVLPVLGSYQYNEESQIGLIIWKELGRPVNCLHPVCGIRGFGLLLCGIWAYSKMFNHQIIVYSYWPTHTLAWRLSWDRAYSSDNEFWVDWDLCCRGMFEVYFTVYWACWDVAEHILCCLVLW